MGLLQMISMNLPAAICLILGLLLVAVEMFIPGFGVPGISGLILLIIGVILGTDSLAGGLLLALMILLILGILFFIALRSASRGALSKTPLVLNTSTDKKDGFSSGEDRSQFLGREGVTVTRLRPVGTADFDGVRLEVLADGEFIETGVPVKVIRVSGRNLFVRPAEEGLEDRGKQHEQGSQKANSNTN